MSSKNLRFFLLLFSLFSFYSLGFAQCPDLSNPSPGIYPDPLPSICPGILYDQEVTVILPADTTIDLSGTPFTLAFDSFQVLSVTGLPSPMYYVCSGPSCVYAPNPGTGILYGCYTLFGTPASGPAPGDSAYFEIEVYVTLFGSVTALIDTYAVPLTSGTPPVASFTTNLSADPTVSFTNTSSNYTSVLWDMGSATYTTVDATHTYMPFPGSYTVCLDATNNCGTDTECQTITIAGCSSAPSSSYSSTPTGGNCLSFSNLSSMDATSFSWDFGDGSTSSTTDPSHCYSSSGVYTICLVSTNGCGSNSSCQTLTVGCTTPTASFSSSTSGLIATFSDLSTDAPTSWAWDFGDGNSSTQQNPTYTYATAGTYTVCLTSTNACGSDLSCTPVTVSGGCPTPVTGFSNFVSGTTATFTDLSTNSPTSWAWDFGDGNSSSLQNPIHTYASTGTYTVCLTSTNACGSDLSCTPVTVSGGCPTPVTGFSNSVSGFVATFTDLSTNSPLAWAWDFGDGTSSSIQNPIHTYASTGTYTVCLTSTNGCGSDSSCSSVTIAGCSAPVAAFSNSSSGSTASFSDLSTNSPTSWTWSFGDGSTSTIQNPVHDYGIAGTFTVCLTATNSCGDNTTCQTVTVTCSSPVSDFTFTSAGNTVTFTDISTGGPTSYAWTFGDGGSSTSASPVYSYATSGTYIACLTTTNACGTDNDCQTITVCEAPVAGFSWVSTGLSVDFTDTTSNSPTTWTWTFGDGASATTATPSHTYASEGTYTVCLLAENACGTNSSCEEVTVMTIGVSAQNLLNFEVFPNPSAGVFHLSFDLSQPGKVEYSVYDLLGTKVMDKAVFSTGRKIEENIPLSDQVSGVYFLEIRTESGRGMRKLVKW